MTPYAEAIEEHYVRVWGSRPVDRARLDTGPVHELPEEFRVLVIPRPPDMVAYATVCMSRETDDARLELHMFARPTPGVQHELVELLTVVAHYHRTGRHLALGHSVNFGRPWLPGSACTHGLISLPYLDGASLETMDRPRVRFLWLVPVTVAELAFRKTHGTDALEQRFEERGLNYLDPLRPSVV